MQAIVPILDVALLDPAKDLIIHIRTSEMGVSSVGEHFKLISNARSQGRGEDAGERRVRGRAAGTSRGVAGGNEGTRWRWSADEVGDDAETADGVVKWWEGDG